MSSLELTPTQWLFEECQRQIARYLHGQADEQSLSCVEILRQAATGHTEALAYMVELVIAIAHRKCVPIDAALREEVIQETCRRLLEKFRSTTTPFQVTTFAAFTQYVTVVTTNLLRLWQKKAAPLSVEALQERWGIEPIADQKLDRVEQRLLANEILAVLTDELEREVVRRRFLLGESPDEIVLSLREHYPDLEKAQVYRLIEYGLRRVRKQPKFQRLLHDFYS